MASWMSLCIRVAFVCICLLLFALFVSLAYCLNNARCRNKAATFLSCNPIDAGVGQGLRSKF